MFFLSTRLTPSDKYIYKHFFNYYKKEAGIDKFLINFNSKLDSEKDLHEFVENVLHEFGDSIIYNIGPNGLHYGEPANIDSLKKLVNKYTKDNDLIIPADSDEFHYFPINFAAIDSYDFDYMKGATIERFPSDLSLKTISNISNYKDLFNTFSFNLSRLVAPKISIIKKNPYIDGIGVGHHCIRNEKKYKKYHINSRTNHFRWHLEGQNRMKFWNDLWSKEEYKGWKGSADKYIEAFKNFDTNGKIYVNNEALMRNVLEFNFNHEPHNGQEIEYNDMIINVINKSRLHHLQKELFNNFEKLDDWDANQIYCYLKEDNPCFVNKMDLFFLQPDDE
jgi:hypothetical protein